MNPIVIEKRTDGGFTINYNSVDLYVNSLNYRIESSIRLYDDLEKLVIVGYPVDFTIDDITGFTTLEEIANALDKLIFASSSSSDSLTNTQLRATPVPVSIASGVELEFKNDSGNPLPVNIANGGNVTLGSTTDDKNDSTNTTAATQIGILKYLSYLWQSLWSAANTARTTATKVLTVQPIDAYGNIISNTDLNGHPQFKPDYFDITTSTTVVYEGYKSGATIILCKIDLTAGTRTWGVDTWANRVTAIYA